MPGRLGQLSTLAFFMLLGLSNRDARACVCSPLDSEEFWPSYAMQVPRAVRPLVISPASGLDAYRLLDAGPMPPEGVLDLGPNRERASSAEPADLGPIPSKAKEIEISARAFGDRPDGRKMLLELTPRHPLAANHRFVLAVAGRVRAVFLTGELAEAPPAPTATPRLAKIEYPEPDLDPRRSFRSACETGSVSLLYWVGAGSGGTRRLFGIWAPDRMEEAPLGFSTVVNGQLELGRLGVCGVTGVFLKPGAHVDLVLRERVGRSFGPTIRLTLDIPRA